MTEQGSKIGLRSLPFEERAETFQHFVQAVGLGVGGEEEYTLRDLGRRIVHLHSMPDGEEREKAREEIHGVYDRLGVSTNPKVGEAILNIIVAEIDLS